MARGGGTLPGIRFVTSDLNMKMPRPYWAGASVFTSNVPSFRALRPRLPR